MERRESDAAQIALHLLYQTRETRPTGFHAFVLKAKTERYSRALFECKQAFPCLPPCRWYCNFGRNLTMSPRILAQRLFVEDGGDATVRMLRYITVTTLDRLSRIWV